MQRSSRNELVLWYKVLISLKFMQIISVSLLSLLQQVIREKEIPDVCTRVCVCVCVCVCVIN